MDGVSVVDLTGRQLRWLADTYEQAQRVRIDTGERIRAVLQGRDETWVVTEGWDDADADEVLRDILAGSSLGPVLILGRTYCRHHEEETETRKLMLKTLEAHPAWGWLTRVRGIGPTLGCKLLARLDAEKAEYASSFWSYCGLGTVPGEAYRCRECGKAASFVAGYKVTGAHKALGGAKKCSGLFELVAGPDDGVRVAQPKPRRGEKASYDQYAKKIMYLVGTSFLKVGGPYESHYRKHRARLEVERPGWIDLRKHYTALRIVEKLFLSHLWQVWREALGLPTPDPYAETHLGHDGRIEPWSMVEAG